MKAKAYSILKLFLTASIISTAIHFTDNYLYFEQYPQPEWITPFGIIRSWLIWTAFGLAGYWLYTTQRFWLAYTCLLIYSTCGLSSLAHYLYGSLHDFSPKMHLLILADGLAGSLILGFTVWSGLIAHKPRRSPS
ncbi:MAG: hypothetical protein DPW18_13720 [Chloroflexi bacterium]|nr:hypothetical protein [Chloroflexi bacterium CFX2]MCQ3938088.1 hypothetical protein [Chloroflexota bacterium]MDL1944449.1 hypothetical protein [Chloroflexi bacterium CFX2]